MRTITAFVAAVLAPVFLVVAWYLFGQFAMFEASDPYIWVRTRNFLIISSTITVAHVAALGVPAFLVLRARGALSWWTALTSGFVLAAIPIGVFSWPLRYASPGSSSSANGVDLMVDGVPTAAGWLQYGQGVVFFGVCGFVAAAAFCFVRGMRPNSSFKPTSLRDAA
jgi:hypothetical protein